MAQSNRYTLPEGNSITRPPLFIGEHYSFWKLRMKHFIQANSMYAWMAIEEGPHVPMTEGILGNRTTKPTDQWSPQDFEQMRENAKVISYLNCGMSIVESDRLAGCETTKEMWEKLEVTYEGTSKVKDEKIDLLVAKIETF